MNSLLEKSASDTRRFTPGCVGAALATAMALPLCANAQIRGLISEDNDSVDTSFNVYFMGYDSNVYALRDTASGFGSPIQLTGFGGRPSVAYNSTASPSRVVGYNNTIYDTNEIFYLTTDSQGSLHVEQLWGSGYSPTDLTALTNAEPASPGSGLVGYIDSCAGTDNVFYIGMDQHIHELTWAPAPGWTTQDLTVITGTPSATGGSLSGHIKGGLNQSQEVFFVDTLGHVRELWRWSGCAARYDGWHNTDLHVAGGGGATPIAGGSLATYYDPVSATDSVIYVGTNQHVEEYFFSTAATWSGIDVTASFGGPVVGAGNMLSAHFNSLSRSEEVFYLDGSANIHEVWAWSTSPTVWTSNVEPINEVATKSGVSGGAPAAYPYSPITTVINATSDSDDVYYISPNSGIYRLSTSGVWIWSEIGTGVY